VVNFVPSLDNKKLALLRKRQVVGDEQRFNLEIYDQASGQAEILAENLPEIYHLALSANGRYLAYTTQKQGGKIELLSGQPEMGPVELAVCEGQAELICTSSPVWAPDRAELAWGDSQGVWLAPANGSPVLALPASIPITDPRGGTSQITVQYEDLSWSPFGRYLLAKVRPVHSEVRWWGLLDTKTGRQAEIPGTYELGQDTTQAAWMGDGRVVAGLPGMADINALPKIQVWQVLPTRDDLLLSELETSLPLDLLPPQGGSEAGGSEAGGSEAGGSEAGGSEAGGSEAGDVQYSVIWLSAYRSRYLSFGVRIPDSQVETSLYLLDLKAGSLAKINDLPATIQQLSWSPSGSDGVAWQEHRRILYIPGDGLSPIDLLPEFGSDAHLFTWIPLRSTQP
jgi:hypothetical protein